MGITKTTNFIYSTTRTNSSLLSDCLQMATRGEGIRFWQEHVPYSQRDFKVYRVYAQTLESSDTTMRLMDSKGFKQIDKDTFELNINLREALEFWEKYSGTGDAKSPSLFLMAGVPLSGKTTLSQAIKNHSSEKMILIENDKVRQFIAKKIGYSEPQYKSKEHQMTFNVSWELIRLGLTNKFHVIFDATNLKEDGRWGAYSAAEQYNAVTKVILVKASKQTLLEHYNAVSSNRKKAYEKLGDSSFNIRSCSKSLTIVNSEEDEENTLKLLRKELGIPMTI